MFASSVCVTLLYFMMLQALADGTNTSGSDPASGPLDVNAQIISDLSTGRRTLLGLGMSKARFIVLIGSTGRESNPNNIYVYNPTLSSIDLESTPPTIALTGGAPLSVKYPALYKALQGATVRNRTVVVTDDTSSYILFGFDSNGTDHPLLYSINEERLISDFKGAAHFQEMLNLQFQVFTLISSKTAMRIYSFVKYYFQPQYTGPDPNAKPPMRCIFEIDSWAFNGSSLQPKKGGTKLEHIYYQSSICKEDSPKTVAVSKDCKHTQCLDWELMAGFANEKRVFLVGRKLVHAVENVFAGPNAGKRQLGVMTFKMTDMFVPVAVPKKATLAPSSMVLIGVICLLLFIAIMAIVFWLCMKKNFLYFDTSAPVVAAPNGASASTQRRRKSRQARGGSRRSKSRSKNRGRSQRRSASKAARRSKTRSKTKKSKKGRKSKRGR